MSAMKTWLKWITSTIVAIIIIAILVSGGVVFLAIGAVISLMFIGALFIALVAYLVKDLFEYVLRSK